MKELDLKQEQDFFECNKYERINIRTQIELI